MADVYENEILNTFTQTNEGAKSITPSNIQFTPIVHVKFVHISHTI